MHNCSSSRTGGIYGFTKFVARLLGILVPFAFIVLCFFRMRVKQLFVWPMASLMSAASGDGM
jgi:hypothetical protein